MGMELCAPSALCPDLNAWISSGEILHGRGRLRGMWLITDGVLLFLFTPGHAKRHLRQKSERCNGRRDVTGAV